MTAAPFQYELALFGGSAVAPAPRPRFNKNACGIDRCESPLERQLVLAFAELNGFEWRKPIDHPWLVGQWTQANVLLLAQAICGPFRADFALVPKGSKLRDPLRVIVEVDGYDFHDRTREQAQYDRWRDRYLARQGSSVLRFSGSEIWHDAPACAAEVLGFVGRRL